MYTYGDAAFFLTIVGPIPGIHNAKTGQQLARVRADIALEQGLPAGVEVNVDPDCDDTGVIFVLSLDINVEPSIYEPLIERIEDDVFERTQFDRASATITYGSGRLT